MRKLNPAWVEAVAAAVNTSHYFQLESMRIVDLTPCRSRLEIELESKHLQPFGMVHGGVFSGLIDAAGFWAAYTELDEGPGMTTVEMKINYLAPSSKGKLIAEGRCIKTGRTLSLAEATIVDEDGRLLAHGTVTLMTLPDLKLQGQDGAPPKFI